MRALAIATLLLLVGGSLLIVRARSGPSGRVYSVAEARRALAEHRGAWSGRTILVRGIAVTAQTSFPCTYTGCSLTALVDSLSQPASAALWLGQGQPEPLWSTLRQLPWAGRFAPAEQRPLLGRPATYRIRLLARPDCGHSNCFDALLLDGQPANTNVLIPPPSPPTNRSPRGTARLSVPGRAADTRHAPRLHLPLGQIHRATVGDAPGVSPTPTR